MGRLTKALLGASAAALLAAGAASADFVLADFNDGTNVSNIETYFYFYSACADHPLNMGPCKIDDLPVVLGAAKTGIAGSSVGPGDQYGPMSYRAAEGEDAKGPSGVGHAVVLIMDNMNATGETKAVCGPGVSTEPCKNENLTKGYYPGFGFGILLTDSDNEGLASFEGVTGVSFKANINNGTFGFKVEQIENSWDWEPVKTLIDQGKAANPSACYSTNIASKGAGWQEYTVDFSELERPTWGTGTFTRNNKNATKIAWYVNSGDHSASAKKITFMIDDVKLLGNFSYSPADRCPSCATAVTAIPTPSKKVTDFERVGDAFVNTLGYYGYWYTDSVGGGSSRITNLDGGKMLIGPGQGSEKAPVIEFEMGAAYENSNKVKVEPFVGIGTNLYKDQTDEDFLDLKSYNFEGVYFEYKGEVTGNEWLDVELADASDILGGKPGDKDGEVFYVRVPLKNTWQSAKIPFDKFVLPRWAKQSGTRRWGGGTPTPKIPLQTANLAQLKFKVRGGTVGELSVDNIYFYGASEWGVGDGEVSVKHVSSNSKVPGIRATYSRGVVGVNWNAAQSIASGKVQLVNTKGRVVASAPVTASGSKVTANLGAGSIPTGMYFVRMNAVDAKGAKVTQQSAISIVK